MRQLRGRNEGARGYGRPFPLIYSAAVVTAPCDLTGPSELAESRLCAKLKPPLLVENLQLYAVNCELCHTSKLDLTHQRHL
jgi:hypothetical protein